MRRYYPLDILVVGWRVRGEKCVTKVELVQARSTTLGAQWPRNQSQTKYTCQICENVFDA